MIKWRGKQVEDRFADAVRRGIDQVMSSAVVSAKSNHPGWRNRTGLAEGSIRIQQQARRSGNDLIGLWGSVNVAYVKWLEFNHGSFLRSAADKEYPRLIDIVRRNFG